MIPNVPNLLAALTEAPGATAAGYLPLAASGFDFHAMLENLPLAQFAMIEAALIVLLGALVWCLKLRRENSALRTGMHLTEEAATRLLREGEGTLLNLGHKDATLRRLAECFDEIAQQKLQHESAADQAVWVIDELESNLRHFLAVGRQMAGLDEREAVLDQMTQCAADVAGVTFVRLWLLRRYLNGTNAEATKHLEAMMVSLESGAAKELGEVGLMPVRTLEEAAERGAHLKTEKWLPVERVLSAARGQQMLANEATRVGPAGAEGDDAASSLHHALPMCTAGNCIGVLEMVTTRPLREIEVELLRLTGDRTATMLKSIQSTEELTRHREETELKNLDLSLANRKLQRSNARLAESDRLKNEFLSNTSHELRTPLNSVLGFAQLILSGACKSDEDVKSNVRLIRDSAQRLLNLINEVLDLAKIEAGKLSLSLSAVDVRSVVNSAHSLLQVQAVEKGIELKSETPGGELPKVKVDQAKLYQALVNLAGNAIKFTNEGSVTLHVEEGRIEGFVTIEIVDTGIGIDPDVQRKLFQNFVQGDGSISRKYGGTGLGLAISRKLIHMQGGAITLSSAGEGCGTTATIHLPIWSDETETAEAIDAVAELVDRAAAEPGGETQAEREASKEADAEGEASKEAEDASKPLAVIIEDYGAMRAYLAELMQSRGWRVMTASTAAQGLDLIQEHRPAAILLDIYLPVGPDELAVRSGYDVIRLLGQDVEMSSVPIFVITGMPREASDALLGQTVLMPVEVYGKPLNRELFLESLDRLVVEKAERIEKA